MGIRSRLCVWLLCLGLWGYGGTASACARLLLSGSVNISLSGLDTLYHGNELVQRFEVVLRAFDQDCPFILGANAFESTRGGLTLSLRANAQGAELGISSAAGREQIGGRVSAGTSLRLPLYAVLRVSGRSLPTADKHQFTVPLVLSEDQAGLSRVVDEALLALEVHVPAVVKLWVDGSQRTVVSLGDLRRGGEVSVPIRVEANHPISLQVISTHHGYLRHAFLPREQIPYEAWFGGERMDLSQSGHVVRIRLGEQGVYVSEMRFFATEQNLATAGEYSDRLLLSIIAN